MNDVQTTSDYIPQLISIAGTIFGVIFGWVLNYCTGHVGRIKVVLDSFECQKSQSGEYAYILKLLIRNTSQQAKHMRDLNILFCDYKKHILIRSKPCNNTCAFDNIGSKTKDKDITNSVSLNGQDSVVLILADIVEGHDEWQKTTKVFLSYKYKSKTKKLLIIKNFVPSNVKVSLYNKFP